MNIFLIDDEYISNFINRKLIENIDSSLQVTEFSEPAIAYEHLQLTRPDLIFLDINMPVMTGWDFLDKMLHDGTEFKVVILTSSVNKLDRATAKNYKNVIGFLEKPATIASVSPYISQLVSSET